jgi:lipopolysaccharide export system permease protein
MLKKLDKLILKEFLGPFFLTFSVVLFIFLTQFMIKNFKHFVGKGLGLDVYGELFFYFSLVLTPVALPLAVLLASLMTFGSLGEHSELTAIKSSGISLLRILRPISILIFFVTIGAFYFNDQIAPKANLKAYSLLYDIKQKKPSLAFKDEVFYNDLPGYRIKINKKHEDGVTLEGVMIYNHTDRRGNIQVIMAKTGNMDNKGDLLVMNLFDGKIYSEESAKKRNPTQTEFFRQEFDSASFIFSLESFGLKETKEEFFKGHNLMKTTRELLTERDSSTLEYDTYIGNLKRSVYTYYLYMQLKEPDKMPLPDKSVPEDYQPSRKREIKEEASTHASSPFQLAALAAQPAELSKDEVMDLINKEPNQGVYDASFNRAISIYNMIIPNVEREKNQKRIINNYYIDIYRNFTKSFSVFVMFLIGAPLGAIIKKGGLGVPVIVSIVFFIIYYIATILGEKYAREMVISPFVGCWAANFILLCFGLVFLRQARNDARLFDVDYYIIVTGKLVNKLKALLQKQTVVTSGTA